MLSRKLDEIDAGGGTALYDALGYILAVPIKELRGERTAIVVMSDGDDNKSFCRFRQSSTHSPSRERWSIRCTFLQA
jgi:Mg-chelatase subunit ChlD